MAILSINQIEIKKLLCENCGGKLKETKTRITTIEFLYKFSKRKANPKFYACNKCRKNLLIFC